jgi:hypothetical protein
VSQLFDRSEPRDAAWGLLSLPRGRAVPRRDGRVRRVARTASVSREAAAALPDEPAQRERGAHALVSSARLALDATIRRFGLVPALEPLEGLGLQQARLVAVLVPIAEVGGLA